MITLKQLKDKLHKDFGWENLESDDNKWFVDNLLKDTIQAIEVIQCCETLKDKKVITFEEYVDKYYERKDFKYFNKRGKDFSATQITTIYDEHINNL
jgi:hypothetical protein